MTELSTVPAASIAGIVFSLMLAIFFPIALCIYFYKKKGARLSSFLLGCVTFFVSAILLEQILHTLVLGAFGTALTANNLLYALYGGVAAAVFEETGRYIAMKHFMKKNLTRQNALMYGAGHGGIEAILIVGMSYFANLAIALMINDGQFAASLTSMDADAQAAAVQSVSVLWTLPSYQFFMAGVERVQAIVLHIALSVLVFRAVKSSKMAFFWIAMGLHFLVDFSAVALSPYLPVWVLELVVLVLVATAAVPAWKAYCREADE
ncbi:MAG: YhfC family glutamic-type intramembrane protease [Eubacteriales bacterium]|nr:YhfC family glutamic-type intramembrane protease [Eubacteriales bacterium]